MPRLMLLFTAVLLLFSLSSPAQENLYQHPESGLQFPEQLGHFQRFGVERYDDAKLGVQISYAIRGLGKADFYVYTLGIKDIADGTDSQPVRMAYAMADREVHLFVEQGKYRHFKQPVSLGALMHPKDPQLYSWFIAAYDFTPDLPEATPVSSWLLVRGERGHFLKIRYSYRADQVQAGPEELQTLLQAFAEVNPPASAVPAPAAP